MECIKALNHADIQLTVADTPETVRDYFALLDKAVAVCGVNFEAAKRATVKDVKEHWRQDHMELANHISWIGAGKGWLA